MENFGGSQGFSGGGGGQRGISLRPQRMTEEDHRELNVDELEMRAEGWGS